MTAAEREELTQLRLLQAECLEHAAEMPPRILELCLLGDDNEPGFAENVYFLMAHPQVKAITKAITSAVLIDDGNGKHVTVCGPLAEVVSDVAAFLRSRSG